jgi:predicted DCC family thiol-disulfide oxidoreductase YuxK
VSASSPVVVYDGLCAFCDAGIRWLLRRDRGAVLRFATRGSAAADACIAAVGADPAAQPASVLLVHEGRVWAHSDAVIECLALLGGPWRAVRAVRVVPRALRDAVYGFTAARRRAVFGTLDACRVPSPAERARFLDADERR